VTGFSLLLARDLRLALRRPADGAVAIAFFVIAACLFPFGVGADPRVLARIAPGVLWVTALLATLLPLERLFLADLEDGALDRLALAPPGPFGGLTSLVLAKAAAHWVSVGLPLLAASPVVALLLNMSAAGYGALLAALLLGTPTLVLIGAVAAALATGARRGGALLALLALPLQVPVLIFGVGAVEAALAGDPLTAHLQVLAGLLLGAVILAPVAGAAALRLALE
jgi:heme exporter protein B